jgi:hypothetical protein
MQKKHTRFMIITYFVQFEACRADIINMISIFYAVTDLVIKHMGRIDGAKL